jgi:hypothetical protein
MGTKPWGGARSEPLPSPAPAQEPQPSTATEAVPAPAQPALVVEQPPAPAEAAPPPVMPAPRLSEPTACPGRKPAPRLHQPPALLEATAYSVLDEAAAGACRWPASRPSPLRLWRQEAVATMRSAQRCALLADVLPEEPCGDLGVSLQPAAPRTQLQAARDG